MLSLNNIPLCLYYHMSVHSSVNGQWAVCPHLLISSLVSSLATSECGVSQASSSSLCFTSSPPSLPLSLSLEELIQFHSLDLQPRFFSKLHIHMSASPMTSSSKEISTLSISFYLHLVQVIFSCLQEYKHFLNVSLISPSLPSNQFCRNLLKRMFIRIISQIQT